MSAIRDAANTDLTSLQNAESVEPENLTEQKVTTSTHNCALHFSGRFTKKQLTDGVSVPLQGFSSDVSKAVINNVSIKSVSSQSDSPLQISVNLFENDAGKNELGWASQTNNVPEGYCAITNLLPHETGRYQDHIVFDAGKTMDSQYLETYSGFDANNIWDGLVDLPQSTDYMVSREHPVFNIAKANWKVLGLDVSNESIFHGNSPYVSMNKVIVNKIVNELDQTVLSRMPLSPIDSLNAHIVASQPAALVDGEHYQLFAELGVNYTQRDSNPLETSD